MSNLEILHKNGYNWHIVGSLFGAISCRFHGGLGWDFSCIAEDGSLDAEKFEAYMQLFESQGATMTRETPFLLGEKDIGPKNPYKFKLESMLGETKYLPYEWKDGAFDLDLIRTQYFENLTKMADIANRNGLVFCFSIFDSGGHGDWKLSPWRKNKNDVEYWWQNSEKARYHRARWIHEVVEALKGKAVVYEIANEPHFGNNASAKTEVPMAMAQAVQQLCGQYNVPLHNISIGARFMTGRFDEKKRWLTSRDKHPAYRPIKVAVGNTGHWDKTLMFSKIVHHVSTPFLEEFSHMLNHGSRLWLSDDGVKMPFKWNREWWYNNTIKIFSKYAKRRFRRKAKFFRIGGALEHLCRRNLVLVDGMYIPADKESTMIADDPYAILGISEAWKEVTGIQLGVR